MCKKNRWLVLTKGLICLVLMINTCGEIDFLYSLHYDSVDPAMTMTTKRSRILALGWRWKSGGCSEPLEGEKSLSDRFMLRQHSSQRGTRKDFGRGGGGQPPFPTTYYFPYFQWGFSFPNGGLQGVRWLDGVKAIIARGRKCIGFWETKQGQRNVTARHPRTHANARTTTISMQAVPVLCCNAAPLPQSHRRWWKYA
ncbi:hypothetical protein B0H63DRAFT_209406 [Podospora didyma]|uniref:Uncharacterized protein n=1 Tax=Podospora didyma TaxID=330526 RepID=A0AAE0NHM0_9PEZI|nr:hypothetical protein B0H63DRAFT_209406 [Podospora didyma]